MKILLISPIFRVDRGTPEQLSIPSLSLHILAGLTPSEHEVKIVEEEVKLVDINEDCDLVGISCYTANIRRCYELAAKFRARGIPVVLGGIHPTVLPEESIQYADAVVMGEAENIWAGLLTDFKNGKLKKFYRGTFPEFNEYVSAKTRDPKISPHAYGVVAAETSRGCPYTCDFCSVPVHYGRKQRHKPIEHVIRDLKEIGAKRVFFVDDNIMGAPKYSEELMKALIPLNIKWAGQSSIKVIQKNPHLLKLAKKAGCQGLFFGIESVAESSLNVLKKNIREKQVISDTIKMIRDHGIYVYSGMIFGFDEDTEGVFDEALEFVYKNKIATPSFTYLTPYPGTDLFAKLQSQNRIISTNWDDYNFIWGRVAYKPKNFSAEKLLDETLRVKLESSKMSAVFSRFPANWHHPFFYFAINYGQNREARLIKSHRDEIVENNIVIPNTFQLT